MGEIRISAILGPARGGFSFVYASNDHAEFAATRAKRDVIERQVLVIVVPEEPSALHRHGERRFGPERRIVFLVERLELVRGEVFLDSHNSGEGQKKGPSAQEQSVPQQASFSLQHVTSSLQAQVLCWFLSYLLVRWSSLLCSFAGPLFLYSVAGPLFSTRALVLSSLLVRWSSLVSLEPLHSPS